eukprot:3371311-Rhodomonas_salina.1
MTGTLAAATRGANAACGAARPCVSIPFSCESCHRSSPPYDWPDTESCWCVCSGKVKEWALKAGGMFAIEGGGFVRWEEARDSPEKQRTIKWGQLKKEGRAIEKVIRCYGEDVSRLVDLCRQVRTRWCDLSRRYGSIILFSGCTGWH